MSPAPQPASHAFWILLVSMIVVAGGLDTGLVRAHLRRVPVKPDANCDQPAPPSPAGPPPSFMAGGSCGDGSAGMPAPRPR